MTVITAILDYAVLSLGITRNRHMKYIPRHECIPAIPTSSMQQQPTMNLLLLLTPVLFSAVGAEDQCSVFNKEFENNAGWCIQIFRALQNALWNNDENTYIIDEVFFNHHWHSPSVVDITYKVQIIEDEHDENTTLWTNCNDDSAQGCTIQVGWSSTSIYKFIRPEYLLSLQPAWFLSSIHFSTNYHFGFKRQIILHIQINDFPQKIKKGTELKFPLEKITAKVIIVNSWHMSKV